MVYCASGEHCTSAVQVLRDLRYLNVGSLKGGLQGWLEAGGLVESSVGEIPVPLDRQDRSGPGLTGD